MGNTTGEGRAAMRGIVQQKRTTQNKGFGGIQGKCRTSNFRCDTPQCIDVGDIVQGKSRQFTLNLCQQQGNALAEIFVGPRQLIPLWV